MKARGKENLLPKKIPLIKLPNTKKKNPTSCDQ